MNQILTGVINWFRWGNSWEIVTCKSMKNRGCPVIHLRSLSQKSGASKSISELNENECVLFLCGECLTLYHDRWSLFRERERLTRKMFSHAHYGSLLWCFNDVVIAFLVFCSVAFALPCLDRGALVAFEDQSALLGGKCSFIYYFVLGLCTFGLTIGSHVTWLLGLMSFSHWAYYQVLITCSHNFSSFDFKLLNMIMSLLF